MILILMFARQPLRSFQGWQRRVCVNVTLQWVCSSAFVAEFREDVQITIPAIVECLRDSDSDVRSAAIEVLSRLAAQGMCGHHSTALLRVVLKHACSRIPGGRLDHRSCHCGMSEGFSF